MRRLRRVSLHLRRLDERFLFLLFPFVWVQPWLWLREGGYCVSRGNAIDGVDAMGEHNN